ncbi:hypothetical protein Q0812_10260 [Brevundimonas sp. 2R-24]|uniref:Uncharacterized protein n=1 Tax=Peiella sedimenti TaxID=3061083 RepID=A0ABT8SQ50_9CAUL|nr:hypothetical protein [Caulobacteraceae bacterium XZ-24]
MSEPLYRTILARLTAIRMSQWLELVGIVGAFSFIGSSLVGSFVFARWGLSFTAVASPDDIITSGITYFSSYLIALSLATILALAQHVGSDIAIKITRWKWAFVIWQTLLLVAVVYILSRANAAGPILYTFAVCVPFLGIMMDYTFFGSHQRAPKIARPMMLTALIGAGLATLAAPAVIYVADGFLPRPSYIDAQPNCPRARVMWIGSENLVARCDPDRFIIMRRENFDIVVDRIR